MNSPKKIVEIADIRPGFLVRASVKPERDGSYFLLQIRDFSNDRITVRTDDIVRFTPDANATVKPLADGDVLFLSKGARNFACAVSALPTPTLAASSFFVLRPANTILPAYLAWFLNHEETRKILSRQATTGAHMPIITRAVLESLELPVPPLDVQRAIVKLDDLRRQEQRLLEQLIERKQTLISALCMRAANQRSEEGPAPVPAKTEEIAHV